MPKKDTTEKLKDTIGGFLWMPSVVDPFKDIMTSVLKAGKIVGAVAIAIFFVMTWIGMTQDAIKAGYQPKIAIGMPPFVILIGMALFWLLLVLFGAMISPLQVFGYSILTTYPNTCDATHPELHGALCYKPCPANRHRVGDVCWADTVENGLGTPVGLEKCPAGWATWPLTCLEPLGSHLEHGWLWVITGGRTVGRLDNGGVCPGPSDAGSLAAFDGWYDRWFAASKKEKRTKPTCHEADTAHDKERTCQDEAIFKQGVHTERIDGMCYKPCPAGMVHVPLMPYLCVKAESDGKPMRLDYYDADSKIPSMVQLFGQFNPF
jgi:hypothetical protein